MPREFCRARLVIRRARSCSGSTLSHKVEARGRQARGQCLPGARVLTRDEVARGEAT